jgi:[acyl-carrier-protein] S-malonyltransferase
MIAFTFPGQGSQTPGAGAAWIRHPSWEVVRAASAAARRDVGHLLLEADADELKATDNAQLATYVTSLVVLDAARRLGLDAAYVAGHSLGEYTALTAAGVLPLDDGVRLVVERGTAMRCAASERPGTMAAILGGEPADVEGACAEVRAEGLDAWLANFNAPGQLVVAGSPAGVEAAGAAARRRGAKRAMPIAVSGAFHTPYMAPAQVRLDAAIAAARLSDATTPVAANVDGRLHTRGAEWSALLSRQLCSPVRWASALTTLRQAGVDTFIELGPGTVLSGMTKRGVDGASTGAAATPEQTEQLAETLTVGATNRSRSAMVEGETLFAAERLVVSPAAGVFAPADSLRDGAPIAVGDVVGRVGETEVRSGFAGLIMGLLAWRGERVSTSQPLAWLRVG